MSASKSAAQHGNDTPEPTTLMQISSLTIENYKTFREPERVDIRPLTILVGRNSAGKSVIARLPLLLARALGPHAEAPLELEFEGIDFGASFLDLVHNRKPHGAVTIGATFDLVGERSLSINAKVQHFDEYRLQHVVEFELHLNDKGLIKLEWVGTDPLRDASQYRDSNGKAWDVRFQGIFPTAMQEEGVGPSELWDALIANYRAAFARSMGNLTYLGPFREAPRRAYRYPGGTPLNVGSGGMRAPELLAATATRGNPVLAKNVAEWFAQNLGGWRLEVVTNPDTFSLVLHHPDIQDVDINLADVGVGISQVLPIVVQRFVPTQVAHGSGSLEIVEQPELHLHPAAHPAVAELYIAAAQSGSRVIVETHSENFLLRVRRAVAEQRLNADDVLIYWIRDYPSDSPRVMPIRIGADGSVDNWPTGVFSEDFEEVRAIQRAQKGKRG